MGGNKIEPWLTGRYQALQVPDLRNNKRVNRGQMSSVSDQRSLCRVVRWEGRGVASCVVGQCVRRVVS